MSEGKTERREPDAPWRILFVDDETKFGEMLAMYLGHYGIQVRTAERPMHAIELLNQVPFDAVILDLNLAGEDGLEVLRFAKARFPSMPVVIFTGLDMDEGLVKRCLANRADGFISKTAGLMVLLGEVRRHLALKAQAEGRDRPVP